MPQSCRICDGLDLELMIDFGKRPIAHRLLESADETEPAYPMALHSCNSCGLIQILDTIDPEILYNDYNYAFSGWKAEPHIEDELNVILSEGPFTNAVEIGCNDGTFLDALAKRGIFTCVGIEPNSASSALASNKGLNVLRTMLDTEACEKIISDHGRFELVISRQVIEHVPGLNGFLGCIDQLLAEDGILFLDLPDFEPSLLVGDCSAVWEEHVSYFTEPVLRTMLARHGFEVIELRRYDFSGGVLAVLARRTGATFDHEKNNGGTRRTIEMASAYGGAVSGYETNLRAGLAAAREQGAEVVLYGVGVRGCCTVNGLDLKDLIDYAVDDQTKRQGKFMPGSRFHIQPSSALAEGQGPLVCLLAVNNEVEDKVIAKVRESVDRPVTFVSVCSPKDINTGLAQLPHASGR